MGTDAITAALAKPTVELHDGQCPDCAPLPEGLLCEECQGLQRLASMGMEPACPHPPVGRRECEECEDPHEDGGVLLRHPFLDGGESYLCRNCYEWIDDRLAGVELKQERLRKDEPLACGLADSITAVEQRRRDDRQLVLSVMTRGES